MEVHQDATRLRPALALADLELTSSSLSAGTNSPVTTIRSSRAMPATSSVCSCSVSRPARCSAWAWATEPARSWRASRQSKWVDLDSANIACAGPPAKRPPHSTPSAWACSGFVTFSPAGWGSS